MCLNNSGGCPTNLNHPSTLYYSVHPPLRLSIMSNVDDDEEPLTISRKDQNY